MISRVRIGMLGLTATAVTAGLATLVPATATAAPSTTGSAHRTVHTCAAPAAGEAACDAILRTDVTANAAPSGYGPADVQPRLLAARRHQRQQRDLPDLAVVHRADRLGRPHRARDAERCGRVLTRRSAISPLASHHC